ncbi:MAG: GAF domain-containing sensor histidine kinase [Eubacteriales bacterium]|nr:GAF domain-containing sensor histidine kinase [Eubacteriales bacterium]
MQESAFLLIKNYKICSSLVDKIRKRFDECNEFDNFSGMLNSLSDFIEAHSGVNDYLLILLVEEEYSAQLRRWLADSVDPMNRIVLVFIDSPSEISSYEDIFEVVEHSLSESKAEFIMNKLNSEIENKLKMIHLQSEISELYDIGKSLSAEKDTLKLFEKIINACIRLTSSDAGTLYLVVDSKDGNWSFISDTNAKDKLLKFVITKNLSMDIKLEEAVSPIINSSIFGHTALTGKPLRIDDVYAEAEVIDYKHNRSFDLSTGYMTKSMLCIPMKNHRDNVMGVIQLINKKRNNNIIPYDYADEMLINSLAGQAAVALENNLLYREMARILQNYKKQNEHLKFLSRKVLKAHEEERKRIAREIHDGPAQLASSMVMKLEVCRKLYSIGKIEEFTHEMGQLSEGLRSTSGDIRTIIYGLKPAGLDNGLLSAVQGHVNLFEGNTGINVSYTAKGSDENLEYYLSSTIYRIVQEGLSNIFKHANTEKAEVIIEILEDALHLEITDNGKGFDIRSLKSRMKTLEGGFGLEGIKERVELVNGKVTISSNPGKGTKIKIFVPLE